MFLSMVFCTLFLHGLTVHKWQTNKISVCLFLQVLLVNAQDFCFVFIVQVLNAQVFFVLQHAFSPQWTINFYFSSFMSWALRFLFFYVVFSDCSVVLLSLGRIWQHSSVLSTDWTVLRWKFSLRFCECSLKIGFCVHGLEKRRAAFKKYVLAMEKNCNIAAQFNLGYHWCSSLNWLFIVTVL